MIWVAIVLVASALVWIVVVPSVPADAPIASAAVSVVCVASTFELVARLCRAAARALGPDLPTARIVSAV